MNVLNIEYGYSMDIHSMDTSSRQKISKKIFELKTTANTLEYDKHHQITAEYIFS